ncbi:autotransporter outer membrane beta-barrel domain-containing protein [Altererythrobacter fulvus]|uniref:autotransporter outer membrane beta-barrel domain-containing protein n=1 Tax=Caenibius fulvus TaxID=2126012 RepID=UPI003016629F
MSRNLLVSTAASAVVAAFLAAPAAATTISTAVTTPVRTSTANNGSADAVTIASTGSVKPAGGTAVTMDSSHAVTNQGTVAIANAGDAVGIRATDGTNGAIVNSGAITVDESYTPTDSDNDGDLDGPFAQGSNRFGIRTDGVHTGAITNSATGVITVEGNDSAGIWLGGPQNGAFTHDGKTLVTGDRSVGVHAGDVTGNVRLAGTVSATGKDAVGAEFTGDIAGALVVQGTITSTGYRKTSAPSDTSKLDADDLLQGGPALVVAGNVSGGIVLAVPPKDASSTDNDEDDDGIEDAKEGSASVISYGAAPAFVIGANGDDIAIGPVVGAGSAYGVQIQGTVAGNGVYSGVSASGMVIGGQGGAVSVANGMSVSGTISAISKGASATGLRFGAGASVPILQVSGTVSATGGTDDASKSVAIQIDVGANLPAISNSGTIKAIAGGEGGHATAILDKSGSLVLIENSGIISASGAAASSTRNIAIDLSANTTGVVVKQLAVGSGVAAPQILGDVRFGSNSDVFSVADGLVKGNVYFGEGNNSFALSGDAVFQGKALFGGGADSITLGNTAVFDGVADFGGGADTLTLGATSLFKGSLVNSGNLAVTLNGGVLDVSTPASIGSLNVGGTGILVATLDKTAGEGTAYNVAGTASFASGSQLYLRLSDTTNAEGRYTILQAGTLTGASNITTKSDLMPYIFKGTLAADAGPNKLAVDVVRRTTTELGLNRSQSTAYNAIYAALAQDDEVESVFLGLTNADQVRNQVRQMLPDHAGGAFSSISLGSRTFGQQIADPYGPVYSAGGIDIILSAAAWNAKKDERDTAAYDLGGYGFSAAGEIQTGLGSIGLSLGWLSNDYDSGGSDNTVKSNTYELAAYWRGQWDSFNAWARGSYGLASFNGSRLFAGKAGDKTIQRTASREWDGDLVTFSGGASWEGGGSFFYRPTVTFDYIRLKEDGYSDTGGGKGFNLIVDERTSDELAVNGGMTLGLDFSGNSRYDWNWFRVEAEGGWRQIVAGSLGSTTARFEGGQSFTLDPEQTTSGWYARLRAVGGDSGYTMGGEVSAEDRFGNTALAVRGNLRIGF